MRTRGNSLTSRVSSFVRKNSNAEHADDVKLFEIARVIAAASRRTLSLTSAGATVRSRMWLRCVFETTPKSA